MNFKTRQLRVLVAVAHSVDHPLRLCRHSVRTILFIYSLVGLNLLSAFWLLLLQLTTVIVQFIFSANLSRLSR